MDKIMSLPKWTIHIIAACSDLWLRLLKESQGFPILSISILLLSMIWCVN